MKTRVLKMIVFAGILLFGFSTDSFSQTQYLGIWEGIFMNDFKTIVELNVDENNVFSGSIQMYSGENLIQNDQLSKIVFIDNQLLFYIASKESEFKGEFNSNHSELKGEFIFPDTSKHPLTLTKNDLKINELLNDSKKTYSDLKNRKFTIAELKEDFNFMVEEIKEFHPKLDANISKEKYISLIYNTLQNIDSELTIVGYFNLIAPVIESIKCSHTGLRLPLDIREGIKTYENFLPIKLCFEEEKVFCLNNFSSATEIIRGREILSINNIPVQTIKEKLYQFIPSEGQNTTTKDYYLNQNFNTLFNLIDNSETFKIEYKISNSNTTSILKACKYAELETNRNNAENEKPLSFLFDVKNRVGFLRIRSFMFPDINKYIREMDGIFSTLQNENAKQLVIDLRGNSGGHPIFAAQLFSYLINKEFTYFKQNDDIKEFDPLYRQMLPNKIQFEGEIYVLVDGGCLSTTGHLISLLSYYTHATFIGEEPGSTFRCNDFSVKATLPNTGIEVNIPRTTFETAITESEKMVPFIVDYPVSFSIEDYLNGEDSYINCLNNLIGKCSFTFESSNLTFK